jgi:hypothetical protein
MPFVQLLESGWVAGSCGFKQKFVCVSVWQSLLDSAGIASY